MTFRGHHKYTLVDGETVYQQTAKGTVAVRSETTSYLYFWETDPKEEILAGYGDEPFDVELTPGYFRIACDNRAWIAPQQVNQLQERSTDEVFTTLDRPSPLSPEMLAIQRMMRANEIEREKMRERIENAERKNAELHAEQLGRQDNVVLEPYPEEEETPPQPDDTESAADTETPSDEIPEQEADVVPSRGKKRSDTQRSRSTNPRSKGTKARGGATTKA